MIKLKHCKMIKLNQWTVTWKMAWQNKSILKKKTACFICLALTPTLYCDMATSGIPAFNGIGRP